MGWALDSPQRPRVGGDTDTTPNQSGAHHCQRSLRSGTQQARVTSGRGQGRGAKPPWCQCENEPPLPFFTSIPPRPTLAGLGHRSVVGSSATRASSHSCEPRGAMAASGTPGHHNIHTLATNTSLQRPRTWEVGNQLETRTSYQASGSPEIVMGPAPKPQPPSNAASAVPGQPLHAPMYHKPCVRHRKIRGKRRAPPRVTVKVVAARERGPHLIITKLQIHAPKSDPVLLTPAQLWLLNTEG